MVEQENDKPLTSREIERALTKVEKDLEEYHAGVDISPLHLATSEAEVSKQLMIVARRNMSNLIHDPDNRLLSFSAKEAINLLVWSFSTPMIVGIALSLITGNDELFIPVAGLMSAIAFFVTMSFGSDGRHPYLPFRNKVILRKRYKRETRRITAENISNAERNQKLLAGRQKKLDRAEANVRKISDQYENVYPGKALTLSEDKKSVVETYKEPLRPLGSKKEMAKALTKALPTTPGNTGNFSIANL